MRSLHSDRSRAVRNKIAFWIRGCCPSLEFDSIGKVAVFILLGLFLSGAVYRDALVGDSLLAPLDIPFTLFTSYTDAAPTGFVAEVPENHYVVDQVTYDLPLQVLGHEAISSGRFPWWQPFTFGGRPLAADAHANLFDPIRFLLYQALPFRVAYNWTLVLHGLAAGLGMFLLLQTFSPKGFTTNTILAWCYQFCGSHTLYFGHPWVLGATLYLPWIWLAVRWLEQGRYRAGFVGTGLAVGAYILASNLQSYLYLLLFVGTGALCIAVSDRQRCRRTMMWLALGGVAGAALSAVAWLHVIEAYVHSFRQVVIGFDSRNLLIGPTSLLTAPLPWVLGTHKTPDVSKLLGGSETSTAIGFQLFVGSTIWCLVAAVLWTERRRVRTWGRHAAWAALLLGTYLTIVSSPLGRVFYSRLAPMACMGVVVLARLAILRMSPLAARRTVLAVTGVCCIAAFVCVAATALAWLPSEFLARLDAIYLRLCGNPAIGSPMHALRVAQVHGVSEALGVGSLFAISVLPMTVLSVWFLRQRCTKSDSWLIALLLAGMWQTCVFHVSFVPRHPSSLLDALLASEPHRAAAQAMAGRALRQVPSGTGVTDHLYPFEMASFYRTYVTTGYAALRPFYIPDPKKYLPDGRGGHLYPRLQVVGSDGLIYPVSGRHELLDWTTAQEHIELPADSSEIIQWVDSRYPGLEARREGNKLVTWYSPSYGDAAKGFVVFGALILIAGWVAAGRGNRATPAERLFRGKQSTTQVDGSTEATVE